ncbi:MAG: DNA repair protein RecN [Gemmatimonadetes bacterium]|nr:DNA repair protein RecN [Gemmatimonadota bacterium]
MLTELRVRDLAIIADARLELGPGLNVLTGETGAGKTMLVDALALLLGERAASDLVRPGAARAVVEGAFEAGGRRALTDALERLGIDAEDGRLVLKREVQGSGRSRAWVNGSPVTAGVLAELGRLLVDLHGQHETQSLLHAEPQREILDAFGDAGAEAAAVAAAFESRELLLAQRRALETRQAEARQRADYLRHVAEEIARVAPRPDELGALDAEARRLGHAEELGRLAQELEQALSGDDGAASGALGRASRLLVALERIDPSGAGGWRELLEAATLNVEELTGAVRSYAARVELDPARLAEVERRRDALFRLDRKYGPGLDRVLETGAAARAELELLDTAETDLAALGTRLVEAEREFGESCRALTGRRRAAARRLGAAVTKHLPGLGMPDSRFRVALDGAGSSGRHGAERVEFLVELNPGMGERPMARVASGGELSRLMLGLKVEVARHDALPTLVFDEVDQGVGGHVAGHIADALARVAEAHQVLVITHLPQIAARATRHLVVMKSAPSGAAETDVRAVSGGERVEEIARMLGGRAAAATARRLARELLGPRGRR